MLRGRVDADKWRMSLWDCIFSLPVCYANPCHLETIQLAMQSMSTKGLVENQGGCHKTLKSLLHQQFN